MNYPDLRCIRVWVLHLDSRNEINPLQMLDRMKTVGFENFDLVESNLWRYQRKYVLNNIRKQVKGNTLSNSGRKSMVRSMRSKHKAYGQRRRYHVGTSPMGPIIMDTDKLSLQIYSYCAFGLEDLRIAVEAIRSCLNEGLEYSVKYTGVAKTLGEENRCDADQPFDERETS